MAQDLSNLQLITNLTDSLLEVGLNEVFRDSPTHVALKSTNDEGLNWFLEDRLVEALKEHGVNTILVYGGDSNVVDLGSRLPGHLLCEYQFSKLGFQTEEIDVEGNNLSQIKKTSEVEFSLTLWSGDPRRSSHQRKLQGTKTAIVQPRRAIVGQESPQTSKNQRILQPVVISTVSAVVIYLFYALRSR